MIHRILVTLGAPNTITGQLSAIAQQRMDACIATYQAGDRILCTGGWGTHFNQAPRPHAYYAQHYLMSKGVPSGAFIEMALSSNTVDDAVKTKAIIEQYPNHSIVVITSDFHKERAELIFREILNWTDLSFIGAESIMSDDERNALIAHEQQAIKQIKETGLYY